ncbi:MAG: TetM/TetW/TetO/TetS family tetracycline resistance ribosomal protection protein [Oscillospiraceae bacterium]|nr:TetM/TetW/TetO/TetS family tetracycline resistance ribosomal protection protein [Oscillospiraceae bacterium]
MGGAAEKKNRVVGVVAHVDAGKTTLCEALLYRAGALRAPGRVDRGDSFLDTHELERARGITIFSKQAVLELEKTRLFLLDTPGHADFAAEAERTMTALDCALLVVSGTDGVQAHTETVWSLLRRYRVPCLIFVSKMDLPGCSRQELMERLQRELSENCVDFSAPDAERDERVALCDEGAMERYCETGGFTDAELTELIGRRTLFPCFFGSGLRLEGVDELLRALDRWTPAPPRGERFAGRVFKIARDAQGKRMSFVKLSGGALSVRETLRYTGADGQPREEKITQIRRYSGAKYESAETARAGECCALLGLSETRPGQGLGEEPDAEEALLEPVLSYRARFPNGEDPRLMLPKLLQLQEEDPQLRVVWNDRGREICMHLMGRIQTEVLKALIRERFDAEVEFDAGHILYRETIADRVEGVGHFEPLRHYAEVHLILEPLPRGQGLVFDTSCSEDELDRNWQRLILTHLAEKRHPGVLTGSPINDMKITLAAGRAHLKHTEGGDFRQATYRAVRQGLMQARSVLLEPWYDFVLEVPTELIGRAISDVRAMGGQFESPEELGGRSRLEGGAPVAALGSYGEILAAYSRGRGKLSLRPDGYRPCREQERVVAELGYDPESDLDNPADSVFCAHGGSLTVKWNEAPGYMHLESCLRPARETVVAATPRNPNIDERELEAIMEREFGPIKRPQYRPPERVEAAAGQALPQRRETLIVDGYNVIFAWKELKALAAERLDLARQRLMDMLSSYCGYTKAELVLVFDAYRTPANPGSRSDYHNIHVVYTKDGETADAYMEALANEIGKNEAVRVVTSDSLIRLSALRSGVLRCSSGEFEAEVAWVLQQIDEILRRSNDRAHLTKLRDGIR